MCVSLSRLSGFYVLLLICLLIFVVHSYVHYSMCFIGVTVSCCSCLTLDYCMKQLKYRYDLEIDSAKR